MNRLWAWFTVLISGKPHFYVGGKDNPYMLRWYLIPRNHLLNLYLHKFIRDDEDRALHDHPWWFLSFMISGSYYEYTDKNGTERGAIKRSSPSIAFRQAEHCHRVKLRRIIDLNNPAGSLIIESCWTIVLTGSTSRIWGFHCPKGFVPWFDFVDHTDQGNTGKGCGE